ncbi:MAG: YfcC family protein [Bacteroidetes bacterium]|nr:YfcC family protein [Bacteroidota bacterium]
MKKLPSPITILIIVTIIAAAATWVVPAGKYATLKVTGNTFTVTYPNDSTAIVPLTRQTLDQLHILIELKKFQQGDIHKPVSIPGTYQSLASNSQGPLKVLLAPIKGIMDSIDIILFVLIIGGFMSIFNQSGAMEGGMRSLTRSMKGRENWLIIILTFLFCFAGSSYGMAEEALVFYPILIPLFLAAGYDLLVPVTVIFAGTQIGTLSSFSNPFSTIIASNAAGVSWKDGLLERIIMFACSTGVTIVYLVRYAGRIKKNPELSVVYRIEGNVQPLYPPLQHAADDNHQLSGKNKLLLILFGATFITMIIGVVFYGWWLTEMSALFLGSSVLLAFILRLKEHAYIKQFIDGGRELLSVAFIVGVARGVTIVLNEGLISDSILFYAAKLTSGVSPVLFILLLLLMYLVFTLFISSSSGMAVLTMPIIGALAILVHVPGREIVNAYLYGMGIMGLVTPTGLILPSLALANISIKSWIKFVTPLLIMLLLLTAIFLVAGIYF